MARSFSFVLIALAALAATPAAARSWGDVATPSSGRPRSLGGAANGCIAGAVRLPNEGPGYQAIRVSRNRDYGHGDTVAFIGRLGRAAQAAGLPDFYVGDMAQPRGGHMASGHGSHQNGLDVDIWFNLDPKPVLPAAAREDVPLPSMVLPDGKAVDNSRFGQRQITLLRLAASDPRVDRIFVHWTIKQALCERITGDRTWLHRLRPWYGHDEHFHVRLSCPADSPACQGQPAVPEGDGCDASLAWWATHPPGPPRPPARPAPRPPELAQCRALLAAP
jgi:penicillin-insensitive murein endopeptidase